MKFDENTWNSVRQHMRIDGYDPRNTATDLQYEFQLMDYWGNIDEQIQETTH